MIFSVHNLAAGVFWVSLAAAVYTYFGYPALLAGLAKMARGRKSRGQAQAATERPTVTMVVSAHNEEAVLAAKIANCQSLAYPREKLRFVFGSDGSTDGTAGRLEAAAEADERFEAVVGRERGGKAAMLNRLVARAQSEVVVFSDANTMYEPEAVERLVEAFADRRVGVAIGRLMLEVGQRADACETEGMYWRYENRLKEWESELGAVPTVNGGIFAIRRELFEPLPRGAVTEDQVLAMRILGRGHRSVFMAQAVAREEVSSFGGEVGRRIRISAGNFQSLVLAGGLLDPRVGRLWFTFVSHKVLRWLAPLFLLGMLGANVALAGEAFYGASLVMQGAFYAAGLAGAVLAGVGHALRVLTVPRYFLAMNLAVLAGLGRFLLGRQKTTWSRAHR